MQILDGSDIVTHLYPSFYYACWYTYGKTTIRYIFDHNCICSNYDILPDFDWTKYLGSSTNVYIIAKLRHTKFFRCSAYCHILINMTTFSYHCSSMNDNAKTTIPKYSSFTNLSTIRDPS